MIFVVSNGSKILIWKQITTCSKLVYFWDSCFQWFKDTNLKANHNSIERHIHSRLVVSNGSKILIWKQITTIQKFVLFRLMVVSNGSKILIWKQITTECGRRFIINEVVSNGSKILIWKQITTGDSGVSYFAMLFPMVQRY